MKRSLPRATTYHQTKGVALLLTIFLSNSTYLVVATGFPGTLPSTYATDKSPSTPWKTGSLELAAASNSSDELESSSSDTEATNTSIYETQTFRSTQRRDQTDSTDETTPSHVSEDEPQLGDREHPADVQQHRNMIPIAAHPSRPLRTLKKLQAMLDDTDYMTTAPHRSNEPDVLPKIETTALHMKHISEKLDMPGDDSAEDDSGVWEPGFDTVSEHIPNEVPPAQPFLLPPSPPQHSKSEQSEIDKLWTSKDRIKYKKQQERLRRVQEERRRLEHHLQQQGGSSDDDADAESGTDDGLGYTLPNLSVYLSDAEDATDGVMDYSEPQQQHSLPRSRINSQQQLQQQQQPPLPPFAQQQQQQQQQQYQQYPGQYPPYPPPLPDPMQMGPPPYIPYPQNQFMPYPPYGHYTSQQQQMMAAQFSSWAAQATNMPYRPYPLYPQRPFQPQSAASMYPATNYNNPRLSQFEQDTLPINHLSNVAILPLEAQMEVAIETPLSLAEAIAKINFDSLQKISILVVSVVLLCYCAVSPRTLELVDYNKKFSQNMRIVPLAFIAPMIYFLLVFDTKRNDINDAVTTFYQSFTIGYVLAFILEVFSTTLIRIGVFALWEPAIFKLSPEIPSLVVPWVIRETGYMPQRITLFAADFLTTCVASPFIEEYVKLKMLQWSVNLPRNFRWVVKKSSKSKKKRIVAEALPRGPGDQDVCNINSYVTQMLAASMGLKLCDSARRILMYTKASHTNKSFFALCRGIFPIHELCGTMTALALAKRDVLGVNMPLWQMLLPAVIVHGMANFRGMKPIFKWNAATPWSEMQLSPGKVFAKLMWLIILGRALGYCIKNYYLITRQAVKRTTTYAGKHAAFSAELAATEMLKKSKD